MSVIAFQYSFFIQYHKQSDKQSWSLCVVTISWAVEQLRIKPDIHLEEAALDLVPQSCDSAS